MFKRERERELKERGTHMLTAVTTEAGQGAAAMQTPTLPLEEAERSRSGPREVRLEWVVQAGANRRTAVRGRERGGRGDATIEAARASTPSPRALP